MLAEKTQAIYLFLTLVPLEAPLELPPLEPLLDPPLDPLAGELLPLLPDFVTRVRPVLFVVPPEVLRPELPRLMVRRLPVALVDPLFSCLFVTVVFPYLYDG
jgi:hypothetical protein